MKCTFLNIFEKPGFRPNGAYLREMHRFGILPRIPDPGEPVDAYALDQAYWKSFWHRPAATDKGLQEPEKENLP